MPYVIGNPLDGSAVSMDFHSMPKIEIEFMRMLTRPTKLQPDEITSIPRTLIAGKPTKGSFPDILGWNLGPWIISTRLQAIIEALEPGTHDFVPIHVKGEDGASDHGTYHLILPMPALDAVIYEETQFSSGIGQEAAKSSRFRLYPNNGACALDAEIIRGHHLWRGAVPMQYSYFCSDELRDRIKDEGMRGWGFYRCKAQKRS